MKKLLIFVLICFVALSVTGCGKNIEKNTEMEKESTDEVI